MNRQKNVIYKKVQTENARLSRDADGSHPIEWCKLNKVDSSIYNPFK